MRAVWHEGRHLCSPPLERELGMGLDVAGNHCEPYLGLGIVTSSFSAMEGELGGA